MTTKVRVLRMLDRRAVTIGWIAAAVTVNLVLQIVEMAT